MRKPTYRFGRFVLNPMARELWREGVLLSLPASHFDCLVYLVEHRKRPVGKDELIAAVWGSVEVSDNLLAQAITRLRRILGDNGEDQRCIKTLPRVGYRWVVDTSSVAPDAELVGDEVVAQVTQSGGARRKVSSLSGRWLGGTLLVSILLLAGHEAWKLDVHTRQVVDRGHAVVLPALIDAPKEWSWLRLGLMDLTVGDLREAQVPVENSQTVIALLNHAGGGAEERFDSYAWILQPHAALSDGRWHIRLEAKNKAGRLLVAEASSSKLIDAAHSADAFLLAQLGAPLAAHDKVDDAEVQYTLRMGAALHAGAMNALQELIDTAPREVRRTLQFSYFKATLHCLRAEYIPCRDELAALLMRAPEASHPTLRGRVLSQQWYVYSREHKYLQGAVVLEEAIRLLRKQGDTGYLAYAYAQRAELLVMAGKYDEAGEDFGLARVNYSLAGDTAGALGIEESLANLEMRRGHFAQAVPVIRRALAQYRHMGMQQYLPDLEADLVVAQSMLLQHAEAFATTEQYWPLDKKYPELLDGLSRHVLIFQRASALAGMGRTIEASKILEQLLGKIKQDPLGEPGLEATVYTQLAKLALQRNELGAARTWIAKAFSGRLFEWDSDAHDYAEAWLLKASILQRSGDEPDLGRTVSAMQAWIATLPTRDEWVAIQLSRARAILAREEGHDGEALHLQQGAMTKANSLGIPELIIDVGTDYVGDLLRSGKTNEAATIAGQLAEWGPLDWRVVWAQACIYRAMGQGGPWQQFRERALELAGDRSLPVNSSSDEVGGAESRGDVVVPSRRLGQ